MKRVTAAACLLSLALGFAAGRLTFPPPADPPEASPRRPLHARRVAQRAAAEAELARLHPGAKSLTVLLLPADVSRPADAAELYYFSEDGGRHCGLLALAFDGERVADRNDTRLAP